MKKWTLPLLLMVFIQASTAWADAATKLSRGVTNTAFGWFEIVNEIGHESDRHGLEIGVFSGLIRGAAFGITRTLAGVLEIVSFPFPNGKRGYAPLVLPESVFDRR